MCADRLDPQWVVHYAKHRAATAALLIATTEYTRWDRIVLKNFDDLNRLVNWKDESEERKEWVRHFKPVLLKGVIHLAGRWSVVFDYDEDGVILILRFHYPEYPEQDVTAGAMIFNPRTHVGQPLLDPKPDLPAMIRDNYAQVLQDALMLYCTTMAYMEHAEPQYIEERLEATKEYGKKKKGAGKHAKRPVRLIGNKVFRVTITDTPAPTPGPKTPHAWHAESWTVKGHWRTYKKTGRRVWVAAYVKDVTKTKDGKYEPKEYRM